MAFATETDPATYRYGRPILLTLGAQVGVHMQRYYTIGFFLNRVLDRVEQLPKLSAQFPPGLLMQALPSTTVHTMRSYVIEEAEDHAYWVAEGDTRLWRYLWWSHCGMLKIRVEASPTRVLVDRSRLEVCHTMPPWCLPCVSCARLGGELQIPPPRRTQPLAAPTERSVPHA
jgi:hypothetical protein